MHNQLINRQLHFKKILSLAARITMLAAKEIININ